MGILNNICFLWEFNMKQLLSGIWQEEFEGVQIVVNEVGHSIGTKLPDGKVVVTTYRDMPTIGDFVRFRELVSEALIVFRTRKIHKCESKF